MADLFEVLIGTGMRKGEALGLHWNDVHLDQGVLYIHCTLSAIDNQRLVFTTPKTRSSRGWVAISPRVATALRRRARSAPSLRGDPSDPLAHTKPSTSSTTFSAEPSRRSAVRTDLHGCDHHATTSIVSAKPPRAPLPRAPPATSTQANQPRPRCATTLRPPRPGTHEKPSSHG